MPETTEETPLKPVTVAAAKAAAAASDAETIQRHAGIIDALLIRVKHLEEFLSRHHGHDITKSEKPAPPAAPAKTRPPLSPVT